MIIKYKNCDGNISEMEVEKIEINTDDNGDVEMKVTTMDNDYFLLFGERLSGLVVTDESECKIIIKETDRRIKYHGVCKLIKNEGY